MVVLVDAAAAHEQPGGRFGNIRCGLGLVGRLGRGLGGLIASSAAAAANILLSVLLCLAAVWLGYLLGNTFTSMKGS